MKKEKIKTRKGMTYDVTSKKSYNFKNINTFDWGGLSRAALEEAFSNGNGVSSINSILGSVGTMLTPVNNNSAQIEADLERLKFANFNNTNSYEDLLMQNAEINKLKFNWTKDDLGNPSFGNVLGSMGKSALSGAATGATIGGPWGAVFGGIGGAAIEGGKHLINKIKGDNLLEQANTNAAMTRAGLATKLHQQTAQVEKNKMEQLKGNIKAEGGLIDNYFTNGVTFINEGGTHEENPYEGVMVGVDQEGTPNLVEEGEVIWNDYVFSNRLNPTEELLKEVGLNPKYKDKTFAYIAEKLQEESSERALDSISKRGLEDSMMKLMMIQESVRTNKEKNKTNKFNYGGAFIPTDFLEEYKIPDFSDSFIKISKDEPLIGLDDSFTPLEYDPFKYDFLPYYVHIDEPSINVRELLGKSTDEVKIEDTKNPFTKTLSTNTEDPIQKQRRERIRTSKQPHIIDRNKLLRYAPIFGNTVSYFHNLLEKPDFSLAERVERSADLLPYASYKELNDYMNPVLLDRNTYLNPLMASSRGTMSAIQNSGLNPNAVMSNLIANEYNTQSNLGKTLMQMDVENNNRINQALEYNRGTKQTNLQNFNAIQQQNMAIAQARQEAAIKGATIREDVLNRRNQALMSNLSSIYEGLGDMGRENTQLGWLKNLEDANALKGVKAIFGANGGMLTRKKKKYGRK